MFGEAADLRADLRDTRPNIVFILVDDIDGETDNKTFRPIDPARGEKTIVSDDPKFMWNGRPKPGKKHDPANPADQGSFGPCDPV